MKKNRKPRKSYISYLKSSKAAVISLVILLATLAVAGVFAVRLAAFTNTKMTALICIALLLVLDLLFLLHLKFPKISAVVATLLLVAMSVSLVPLQKVTKVSNNITEKKEYQIVQIVALKDSELTPESDLSTSTLGYVNGDDGAYKKSTEILAENGKSVKKSRPFESTEKMYGKLLNEYTPLIVVTPDVRSDLMEIDENYESKVKVLFEKKYEVESAQAKDVDITKEPFVIYLCGTDLSSGGNVNSTGRGDVNILLTVNPKTKQVYMQTIPRDTFVYVACRNGSSKLSYSGWWGGVQSSIDSIERKFGIEINYYAKIDFQGVIDLVDALGGVDVYSHYTYSGEGVSFTEGINHVDGFKALQFARLRKMLPKNELSRGQHQMELIKAIFKKFSENPTYDNAMSLLDAIDDNFVTNIPQNKYYDGVMLVKDLLPQLTTMENHSLDGEFKWHTDEVRTDLYLYYYYPPASEIKKVRDNIQTIKDGGTI